ncbi:AraC family transcriptional regulator [Streptomyces sp. SID3343]|uniref:AraC family transcriptional regulator n=1 Tax=Streptomyces sp. SID3343 TaxID=2690260 RepID=UPI0013703DE0|nr:AraC family transcriptional regulator [Streptomyces sp. SID3343]MYV98694.1 helix-turn-helix domain-containing protein [Streptomyces sp. SID3343]
MDVLGDLLRGIRADGALFDRQLLPAAPWSRRYDTGAPLTLCTPAAGAARLITANGEVVRLRVGGTALVRGPGAFTVVDDPDHEGPTELIVGAYRAHADIGRRLPDALPDLLVLPDDESCEPLLSFVSAEVVADKPGQQLVLDRLLDWFLVCALRDWFDRPDARPPKWYVALGDPIVGAALRAVHDAPARPWTIAALAAEAGVSRTTLAQRFTALVGTPPLAYLTEWRMALAADLLTERESTVAAVARRVGYSDPFAFSTAFKRVRGLSPTAHRSTKAA